MQLKMTVCNQPMRNKVEPVAVLPAKAEPTCRYFGTDGVRGKVGVWPITPDFVLKLGWAVGRVLARQGDGKVLIGKDTRISGYMFESVLEAGLSAAGVDIHLLGPMPTPAIAYLTRTLRAQAGIVISASHNPFYDNGIKFFSAQGTKLPREVELAIEDELEKTMTTVESIELGKAVRIVDAPGRYIEFCKSTVASDINFNGLKIVVDCANGAAYHIAPNVFLELGAEVVEVAAEPNGLNINLDCGATHPELLQAQVLKNKADLGIALDGDGDRIIMVDHLGNIIDGDTLLYIMAKYRQAAGTLKGGVVGTVMSNFGLESALRAIDIDFVRVPVGDRHIISELIKRDWQLGGEPSGHILCSEAVTTGDGIVTALQILSIMHQTKQSLAQLAAGLVKFPQVLINVPVAKENDLELNAPIQQLVCKVEKHLGNQGRVLLRRSGTEPLVRVMVEGQEEGDVKSLALQLAALVKKELT
jgi:phosphoglucosamine mutase